MDVSWLNWSCILTIMFHDNFKLDFPLYIHEGFVWNIPYICPIINGHFGYFLVYHIFRQAHHIKLATSGYIFSFFLDSFPMILRFGGWFSSVFGYIPRTMALWYLELLSTVLKSQVIPNSPSLERELNPFVVFYEWETCHNQQRIILLGATKRLPKIDHVVI